MVSGTDKSVKNIIRQIGYFMLLYDYVSTGFMEGRNATLGTIANDAAVISQLIDAINPYHIHVEFELER